MFETEIIHSTRLPNGVLVMTEAMPGVESVSVGVWTDAGSSDECHNEFGQAHFLEHMLFKGTETRSAFALAEEIEDVGGQLNAFTERDVTNVNARLLAEHLPVAIELMADMLCHSAFAQEELDRERQVIIEEIRRYEALPDERIHDLIMEALWRGGRLGHPILGTEESIGQMTRAGIEACWQRHFSAERVIITAAGKLEHDHFVDLVAGAFTCLPAHIPPRSDLTEGNRVPLIVLDEDEEQVNFSWGARAYPARDDRNFPLAIIDAALGSSTTSRLFQEIREKRGLAYEVSSYVMGFRDTGVLCATGATSAETFPQVVELIRDEIIKLRKHGLSAAELNRAKEQMKAGMAIALESTSERMRRMATHQLTWGRIYSLGELIDRFTRVTLDDTAAIMDDLLDLRNWSFTAIGPVNEAQVTKLL